MCACDLSVRFGIHPCVAASTRFGGAGACFGNLAPWVHIFLSSSSERVLWTSSMPVGFACMPIGMYPEEELDQLGDLCAANPGRPGPVTRLGGGPGPEANGRAGGPAPGINGPCGGRPGPTYGAIPDGGPEGTVGPFPELTELGAEGGPEGKDLELPTGANTIALCDPCREENTGGSCGGTAGGVKVLGAAGQEARRPLVCPDTATAIMFGALWPSS